MENEKLLAKNLFDYSRTIAKPLLETVDYPWEALPKISEFIIELGKTLDPEIYEQRGENVWVAKSAKVFDSAYLGGPLIICEDAEIRQCACKFSSSHLQDLRLPRLNRFRQILHRTCRKILHRPLIRFRNVDIS